MLSDGGANQKSGSQRSYKAPRPKTQPNAHTTSLTSNIIVDNNLLMRVFRLEWRLKDPARLTGSFMCGREQAERNEERVDQRVLWSNGPESCCEGLRIRSGMAWPPMCRVSCRGRSGSGDSPCRDMRPSRVKHQQTMDRISLGSTDSTFQNHRCSRFRTLHRQAALVSEAAHENDRRLQTESSHGRR